MLVLQRPWSDCAERMASAEHFTAFALTSYPGNVLQREARSAIVKLARILGSHPSDPASSPGGRISGRARGGVVMPRRRLWEGLDGAVSWEGLQGGVRGGCTLGVNEK